MSVQRAVKNLITELANLVDNNIIVKLVDGSTYEGKLVGIDISDRLALHLVLENARSSNGKTYYKVFINGSFDIWVQRFGFKIFFSFKCP